MHAAKLLASLGLVVSLGTTSALAMATDIEREKKSLARTLGRSVCVVTGGESVGQIGRPEVLHTFEPGNGDVAVVACRVNVFENDGTVFPKRIINVGLFEIVSP